MQLWEDSFGDKEEFVNLFFKRVYRKENALIIEQHGSILSTLQLVTYKMNYYGEEIPMSYIVGACTQESYRNKGLMSSLMMNAFETMKSRNVALAALIPAGRELFGYYSKFGFTHAFEYSLNIYTQTEDYITDNNYIYRIIDDAKDKALQDYFMQKLKERPVSVLHYAEDFDTIIQDVKLSDGVVFAILDKERLCYQGLAFATFTNTCKPDEDKGLLVKEFVYENNKARDALLGYITDFFKVKQTVYRRPCTDGQSYSYGMARVIDTERMVDLWLSTHSQTFYKKDELMVMDVQKLTSLLLDYTGRTAYMSLMLD